MDEWKRGSKNLEEEWTSFFMDDPKIKKEHLGILLVEYQQTQLFQIKNICTKTVNLTIFNVIVFRVSGDRSL